VNHGSFAALIGEDVTVGHMAIIHACTLKDRAFVAMGATVLDGAVIEPGGMLGAGGLLTYGKVIGPNELWMGAPARLVRVMEPDELALHAMTAPHYVGVAARFRAGLAQAG
jgi:carbonic anhydrase/acetyltransferase-like protein (isoleucine patch superfamily)